MRFAGFGSTETFTEIPDTLLRDLLPEIEDAAEWKVTLHALYRIQHMEGRARYLRASDFAALGPADEVARGLDRAVRRGTLLRVESQGQALYFLNSPRGRAAAQSLEAGQWSPSDEPAAAPSRPNIFVLYEQNIGPLTPLLADALREAEAEYPPDWIEDALREAVAHNKRNWKYVQAILKRWKEEGRAEEQTRRDAQKDRRRYVEGEFADFVEH